MELEKKLIDKEKELKNWLFNENLRLESLRSELNRASKLVKERVNTLEQEKQLFQNEKQEFQAEMKEWSNRIRTDKKKLEEEQKFFDKKFKILEMGFKQLDADRQSFEAKKRAFEYSKNSYAKEESEFKSFIDVSDLTEGSFFFRGVTHPLALKKRYKDLIKIYHPDNNCGDRVALQQINKEYDKLKNIITYQKKA